MTITPVNTHNILKNIIGSIRKSFVQLVPLCIRKKLWEYRKFLPRRHLRFDVHITDHCNLKCRGCEHFSSLAPEKFLDLNVFRRNCERLAELTGGQIDDISIMGGEPLLHPRITEFLDIARTYFKTGMIRIITNGILLLKQTDDFWRSCQKNNIKIYISVYPVKLKYDEIKAITGKYGVELVIWGDITKQNRAWWKKPLDPLGRQDKKHSFKKCYMGNFCIQLVEGKIYPCAVTAYIKYFNHYFQQDLEITDRDYIDIYKAKSIREILQFLSKPVPFCRYCDIDNITRDLEWGITKKEISEWI